MNPVNIAIKSYRQLIGSGSLFISLKTLKYDQER